MNLAFRLVTDISFDWVQSEDTYVDRQFRLMLAIASVTPHPLSPSQTLEFPYAAS